jgi:hypothetical protein
MAKVCPFVGRLSNKLVLHGRDAMATEDDAHPDEDRRAFLQNAGKAAVVVPPAMSLLLSTSMSSPAIAHSGGGFWEHGNNGVGNGVDPQPPGDPPINDGPGTGPGNPGNRGHGHG